MSTLNRAQRIAQAILLDSVAGKSKERSAAIRADLEIEARKELADTGTAPTWRLPGGGTVPLNMTQDAVEVVDEKAYIEWVHAQAPDEVEVIVITQVRPAYDKVLREKAAKRGQARDSEGNVIPGAVQDATGKVIPGLVFKPGGVAKGISIRAAAGDKEDAGELAAAFVDSLLQSALEVPSE